MFVLTKDQDEFYTEDLADVDRSCVLAQISLEMNGGRENEWQTFTSDPIINRSLPTRERQFLRRRSAKAFRTHTPAVDVHDVRFAA